MATTATRTVPATDTDTTASTEIPREIIGVGGEPVEAFTYSYEAHSAKHCSWRAETTLEELSDSDITIDVDAGDDGCYDIDDVRAAISDMLDDLDDDSDHVGALEAALAELAACTEHRCDCSTGAWESDKDWFDETLAVLGEEVWAVTSHGEGRSIISDTLSVETLFDTLPISRSYGFDDIELNWNGKTLDAAFGGYPWGHQGVTATPLRGVRLAAYHTWTESDCDDGDVLAAALTATPLDVLEAAVEIVEEDRWDFSERYFTDLLELLGPLGGDHNAGAREIALGLIDTWDAKPGDLAEVCAALAAAPA